jgi:hypothetical protein
MNADSGVKQNIVTIFPAYSSSTFSFLKDELLSILNVIGGQIGLYYPWQGSTVLPGSHCKPQAIASMVLSSSKHC